ncbi:MAG: paraslipin [Legionellales bacterium]|mgnify:FL=1|nr:paraslipin [Legionellales bacterium]|tara:strand:+ start:774 stop:1703 length:930 start_codon:yes stop_codon:yes gene_type:complete
MNNYVPEILALIVLFAAFYTVTKGLYIVPQSMNYVVERLGRYKATLRPGLNLIIPYIDRVEHKLSILERALETFKISVITKDNVEIKLHTTVFYRIIDASKSVYRIAKDKRDAAIETATQSIVRSAAGKLDLDDMQASRSTMNTEIQNELGKAADIWGIEITRTEIIDIEVDETTKKSQRLQLDAERERRASVTEAEGQKKSIQLNADALFYQAQKEADAIRVKAEAEAFAIRQKAEAQSDQTRMIAAAIKDDGQPAINFEILSQQVQAISELAKSGNSKTMIMPSDITKVLGSLELISDVFKGNNPKK